MYWIGDLQGCNASFGRLLEVLDFSPSRDRLVVLGDLINRGPDSLGVLKRLTQMENSATCLLGNHDLFVLAAHHGAISLKKGDTAQALLESAQAAQWMDWLAWRPMVHEECGCLLVHAGVLPQWTPKQTLALGHEVEQVLRGPDRHDFLHHMFGNQPTRWHDELSGHDRLRVIVNALTRLRFCTPEGEMEFATKEGPGSAPAGYMPWFEVPERRTRSTPVVFGHWSMIGGLCQPGLACLDTGCLWGRQLSALRVPEDAEQKGVPDLTQWEWISVPADPGDVVPLN
jgi:bis(5'-nucleosyl)-tetraphosphatase (symmetrical)